MDEPRKLLQEDNINTIKLLVQYDDFGSYVLYNGIKVYVNALQKDYGILKEIETICEPINTYILFEIKELI